MSEVLDEGSTDKPRTGSLFKTMSLETIDARGRAAPALASRTLTAPDGEEIQVANGRYGPYIKKGTETRSLGDEEQLFTVTTGGGACAARPAQGAARPGRRRSRR